MATFLAEIAIFLVILPTSSQAISCLVVRPGYGLVSEQCPPSAVGCRIRVMSDRIDWYEWAKLYDRNQLVCIYPEEYKTESGCQKKASGSVRCWCGGTDDCNNAENSKHLYERYIGPLDKKSQLTSNRVITTTKTPSTTTESTTTRRTTTKKVTPRVHIHTSTRRSTTTTSTRPSTTTTKKVFTEMAAHPLPTDARDKYDEIFEETRRTLEAQMKEEDERLQQMLMDEEGELKDEVDQPTATTVSVEEFNRLERRERARIEEKRRQEEEERLARMEREEAEELERKTRERQKEEEEEEDYVYDQGRDGFGLTSSSTSNLCSISTAIFLIFLR